MRDAKEDVEALDAAMEMIEAQNTEQAHDVIARLRNSIASDAGLCCCDGCGEWVPMAGICADDMCVPCHENRAQAEVDARDDALIQAADDRIEAEKINRHLWSLGGGRLPLILIAAWSVVAACGGVPWQ